MYVSFLRRDSSETFRLTRQTSRLKSRGGNLALYHIRICLEMFNIENVQHETEICLGKYKFVAEGGLKAKLATEFVAETT